MDRRAYLTALGATVATIGGCSGSDSTETASTAGTGTARETGGPATATERGTDEPSTAAEQPEPDPSPLVTEAGLLLDRGPFETVADIDGVGRGGILVVGVQYGVPVRNGRASGAVEASVRDSDGTELDSVTGDADPIVIDDPEYYPGASWFAFDTEPWATGSYTVDMYITSDEYGTTAETAVSADIVEPLGPDEVELRLVEFPDDAVAGEEFSWTLGFRNRTDRDSSVVADTVILDPDGDDPVDLNTAYRQNVPAGEEIQVEQPFGINLPGTYTYRIDEIDAEFTFTIEPRE